MMAMPDYGPTTAVYEDCVVGMTSTVTGTCNDVIVIYWNQYSSTRTPIPVLRPARRVQGLPSNTEKRFAPPVKPLVPPQLLMSKPLVRAVSFGREPRSFCRCMRRKK